MHTVWICPGWEVEEGERLPYATQKSMEFKPYISGMIYLISWMISETEESETKIRGDYCRRKVDSLLASNFSSLWG